MLPKRLVIPGGLLSSGKWLFAFLSFYLTFFFLVILRVVLGGEGDRIAGKRVKSIEPTAECLLTGEANVDIEAMLWDAVFKLALPVQKLYQMC